MKLSIVFSVALVSEVLLRFGQLYSLEKLGQNIVFNLRRDLFAHIQRLSSAFFDRTPVGKLVSRVTSDVDAVHEAFTSGLVLMLADLAKLAAIIVILLRMNWRLALVSFAIIPPMALASWFFRVRVRRAYRSARTLVGELNSALQENVAGMRLVQLFQREAAHQREFSELNTQHRDAELNAVYYESVFSALAELLGSLTLAAIIWAGGARLLGGGLSFGTLVAFIEYSRRFFRPLQELSQRLTVMQAAMAAAERIFELLDTQSEIVASLTSRTPTQIRGEIAFEDVSFSYGADKEVLHTIRFHIAPGERIGVVGWTGSGKSTLIRLLSRLYDPLRGRVLLDGIDLRAYDLRTLRRAIGVVLQEPFLFAGTVRSNITLSDPAIDETRLRAAAAAVRAESFIERLPLGYDEPVREGGSNFSTGEKQLICFARALAFDPAIIVLDEATASVDPQTESLIKQALDTLLAGRSSIIIAHRLATVREADRILVLHQGELREQGRHAELLAVEGGIYRTLHELQSA